MSETTNPTLLGRIRERYRTGERMNPSPWAGMHWLLLSAAASGVMAKASAVMHWGERRYQASQRAAQKTQA